MNKTPLAAVKERFGSKAELLGALAKLTTPDLWIDRVNEQKGFERVSNAKLLRLHDILSEVKEKFGSRAKLIDSILELERRTKDQGLKSRLEKHPTPRLLDLYRASTRRSARAKSAPERPKPPKLARSRKAQAKVRQAKPS
jgi:hypothetical protein